MSITRRVFLKNGALAIVGTSVVPSFLTRAVYAAETAAPGKKRLIVLFQRGAADGLNIVVPHGEQAYYNMRPSIAIPRQSVIDLDGFFGLHPSMSLSSRCGTRSISPSCMPRVRRTTRAPTLTRRTTWNQAHPA